MSKHTPGPWHYDADDKFNADRAYGIVRPLGDEFDAQAGTEGATEVIAEVCGDCGSGTAEADARLISAAPDLLAACNELCACVVRIQAATNVHREGSAVTMARAAIAKATGK